MNVEKIFAEMEQQGYTKRESQLRMAMNIEWGIENGKNMIFEAPTGTGKSLAYLIPTVLAGKKTVITTNNKQLQDQLNNKDIPAALRMCKIHRNYTVLKGRSNYLCSIALDKAKAYIGDEMREAILQWAKNANGDLSYFPGSLDGKHVEHIRCNEHIDHEESTPNVCYHAVAKEMAFSADIVIVNHTLLAIDGHLRNQTAGNASVLPDYDVLIIDEVHELAESVKRALEDKITPHSLQSFFSRIKAKHLNYLASEFEGILRESNGVFTTMSFESIVDRIRSVRVEGKEASTRKSRMIDRLKSFSEENENEGRWVEGVGEKVSVNRRPLFVGEFMEGSVFEGKTVFATSATLATNGSFEYIQKEIGLKNAKFGVFDSPFNYAKNCMIFCPHSDKTEKEKVEILEQLLDASQGRAFVLFTSTKDMIQAHSEVSSKFPILIQGEGKKTNHALLEEFRSTPGAVLFALRSFWQGVDVQGDALSMVVIWRLPFEYWGDPIVQILNKKMKNHFKEKYLPDCIINLKQGVGRLIRTETDRGVIAVLDSRIRTGYRGRIFLNLPKCRDTGNIKHIQQFFDKKPSKVLTEDQFFKLCRKKGVPETKFMWNAYVNKMWDKTCLDLGVDPKKHE